MNEHIVGTSWVEYVPSGNFKLQVLSREPVVITFGDSTPDAVDIGFILHQYEFIDRTYGDGKVWAKTLGGGSSRIIISTITA